MQHLPFGGSVDGYAGVRVFIVLKFLDQMFSSHLSGVHYSFVFYLTKCRGFRNYCRRLFGDDRRSTCANRR